MDYKDLPGWFDEGFMRVYDRIVQEAPEGTIIAEVGCWKGKSGAYLLEQIKKSNKELHVWFIDTYTGNEYGGGELGVDEQNFLDNLWKCGFKGSWFHKANFDREPTKFSWQTLVCDSIEASQQWIDKALFAVMLDGNHQSDYVRQEILSWKSKTRILAGHDFLDPPIRSIVSELLPNREDYGSCYFVYL